MSHAFLQPGRAYSFEYPRHNYRQLPSQTELRRIVVAGVRDINGEPLDQSTISLNPFLVRGRWLVTGKDLDKEVERTFYFESMTNIRALSEDDLHPLRGVEYVVIEQTHVAYTTRRLGDALAFRMDRQSGTVCAVLCHAPREFNLDSIEDMPPVEGHSLRTAG
jgi:hypothetical protein